MSSIDVTQMRSPVGPITELTIADIFAHAKKPTTGAGDFPSTPTVFATYVDHDPHAHPDAESDASLVRYAHGPMKLSADKKKLTGQMRLWRNIEYPGSPGFFGTPATPVDEFDDPKVGRAITISVTDSGQVTYQMTDVAQGPVTALNAPYVKSVYVETSSRAVRTLSFTLGEL